MIGILLIVLVLVALFGAIKFTAGVLRIMLITALALAPFILVGTLIGAGSLVGTIGIIALGGPGLALGLGVALTAAGAVYIGTVPGMLGLVFGLVLMAIAAGSF